MIFLEWELEHSTFDANSNKVFQSHRPCIFQDLYVEEFWVLRWIFDLTRTVTKLRNCQESSILITIIAKG